jgi:hypothetical protein
MAKGMTLNWETPRRQVTTVLVPLSASTGTCQNREARSSIVAHPSDWIALALLTGLNLMGCVTALFMVVNYEMMRNICFQHCLGRSPKFETSQVYIMRNFAFFHLIIDKCLFTRVISPSCNEYGLRS